MKRNILRSFFTDFSDGGEDRNKFIQKRLQIVQRHVPTLKAAVSDYANKNAVVMESVDRIASILQNYAKEENVTTGMKRQISEFANILREVGSRKSCYVKSMEADITEVLSEYGKLCKNINSELKCTALAMDKERVRSRQLRRAQTLDDQQQISSAETELMKVRGESSRLCKSLEEQIDIFERRRLTDLREALLSWATAELRYHAKAIELFTDAYNAAAKIDVEADVEQFRNKLREENTPRLDSSRETTFRRSDSLAQLLSMPFHRNGERLSGIGIPHFSPSRTSSAVRNADDVHQSCIF